MGYNFNSSVVGAGLTIQYPPALLFIQDHIDATLWLGQSNEGLSMVWQTPRNGFEPLLLFRTEVIWTQSCDCNSGPQPVYVTGYNGGANPAFVRWPDYTEVLAVGMMSLICRQPPISVESTTWGRIKALYR